MIAESLARRYSLALFNLARERSELEAVHDEFQMLNDFLTGRPDFRRFVLSPRIDVREKKKTLLAIFGGELTNTMLNFIYLLLDKKRQTLLLKIREHFVSLYLSYHRSSIITVTTAVKLSGDITKEITHVFEKLLECSVIIQEKVEPSIIGGLRVRVHNTIYDASIAQKLRSLRLSMTL